MEMTLHTLVAGLPGVLHRTAVAVGVRVVIVNAAGMLVDAY